MTDFNQVDILSGEIAPLPPNFRDALNGNGSAVGAIIDGANEITAQAEEVQQLRAENAALRTELATLTAAISYVTAGALP